MQSLKLSEIVINWYKKNLRILPWRPKNFNQKIDPYIVFLSEFMLQQTTVKTVIPYFINFLEKYPTIEILAKAKLDDVLAIWSGLGYYRRANNLYKSAKIITNELNGVIPNNYEDLIKLPGIGDYTAAAICAIAFDKKVVVIDGNIERVISRLFELDLRGKDLKKKVNTLAKKANNQNEDLEFIGDKPYQLSSYEMLVFNMLKYKRFTTENLFRKNYLRIEHVSSPDKLKQSSIEMSGVETQALSSEGEGNDANATEIYKGVTNETVIIGDSDSSNYDHDAKILGENTMHNTRSQHTMEMNERGEIPMHSILSTTASDKPIRSTVHNSVEFHTETHSAMHTTSNAYETGATPAHTTSFIQYVLPDSDDEDDPNDYRYSTNSFDTDINYR